MNRKSIGLLLISILLVVGIIWTLFADSRLRGNDKEKKPETTQKMMTESIDPFLPPELKRPVGISWNNFKMDEITATERVTTTVKEWGQEEVNRVVLALGEKINSIGQSGSWTTFGSEKRGGFIDRLNNLIEWQKRIDDREEIPKGKLLSQNEIGKKITDLTEKIGGEKVTLIFKPIKYVKVLYPRWIECPMSEADMVVVGADMEIEGKKITNFYGEMVTVVIGKGGEIIKLTLRLPPKIKIGNEVISFKTTEEIKKGRINNFGIRETDTKVMAETDDIRVNAVTGELVYIYEAKSNWVKPFLAIEGNTFAEGAPLRVSMLYSAAK